MLVAVPCNLFTVTCPMFPELLSVAFIDKAHDLGIRVRDIDESFSKGGGPGGQNVNKAVNCVHLLHRPTGILVKCQRFRERERNRAEAYRRLINKIEDEKLGRESARAKQIYKIRKQKQKRSKRAKEKMLADKKHRSEIKKLRRPVRVE